MEDWANFASLDIVDHFNKETELIADKANRAKVIIYLDKRKTV